MLTLVLKAVATAVFIVALSEIGKRSPNVAGLIVALPLATAMTMVLMHVDGEGSAKVAEFARATLLFVPPSTIFLVVMWAGMVLSAPFWATLAAAVAATGGAFWLYTFLLSRWGVSLF
jgi:hypothetical protein